MPGHHTALTFTQAPRPETKSSAERARFHRFVPLETGQPVAALASPARTPSLPPDSHAFPRCTEKGCIFPATRRTQEKCLLHNLQQLEPTFFQSFQPSMLLLDQARFGVPHSRSEDERARDRHRLAALRKSFWEEAA